LNQIKKYYDEIESLYDKERSLLIELEEKFKPLEEEYIRVFINKNSLFKNNKFNLKVFSNS
jgi:hypothetical protein